ncbi:hypothetical protein QCB45_08825 [Thiomicrorhabdus sp. ZW0627]|uniref:hypothetical protein n=1 Tax=Thiomicrorhabdus sp. ZW0627 TaxID=3039774 RepID=UPI0024366A8B|nr:hypothetical protein [Thiomicrorhabdus sp. ZW0627]MDG6774432.1 hypothetical protein [Thiomicrorhabdus sp. ZW0627]
MNAEQFKQALNDYSDEQYQAILDGASMVLFQDRELTVGKSEDAYVIFELGDESFDSINDLKSSLLDRADDLIQEYYQYNPVSRQAFDSALSALIAEHGNEAFVAMPGKEAELKIFVDNDQVICEGPDSPRFKYGIELHLEDKMPPLAISNKVKNWIQSGSAYGDYISVNVCRFSSTDMENISQSEYI